MKTVRLLAIDPGEHKTGFVKADVVMAKSPDLAKDNTVRFTVKDNIKTPVEVNTPPPLTLRTSIAPRTNALRVLVAGEWDDNISGLSIYLDIFDDVEGIIMEEYRIRPRSARQHIGSTLLTTQLIGAIRFVALTRKIPVIMQSAGSAKQQWTDRRMRKHFNALPKSPHIRDAFRHLILYLERQKVWRPSMGFNSEV